MAYGIQNLRRPTVYGGYGSYSDEPSASVGRNTQTYNDDPFFDAPEQPTSSGLQQIGSQQSSGYGLGSEPESQPELANIKAPTIEAPRVDPTNRESSAEDIMNIVNRVYTPATKSRDRYDTLLDTAPERNKPGIGRALVAAGLSLKAQDPLATTEKVMYAPYYRQQADWKEKAEPFYKAAQLENTANVNERNLAGNVVTATTQANKLAEAARQADQRAEIARTTNRIREAQAAGLDVKLDGDRWVGFDNQGRMHELGTSRGMTREQIIDAQGRWNVKASGARADTAAANAQETPIEYTDPNTGKKQWGYARGGRIYPLEVAQPGERPSARPSAGPGVGTSVPITPPGTASSTTPRAPGKPVTGALNRIGTEDAAKTLTPLEQRMETNNKIAGILSRHPDWNNFINYNSDTELYEGMGAPPQPPKRGLFGLGGGSDEDWQRYKDDMDGYNYLRSLLHPGMAPYPTVGGSNAEQKAAREKAKTTTVPSATTTTPPPTGLGPSGYPATSSAPTTSTIGPSTAPNSAKSLPGGGSTTKSNSDGTWMPPSQDNKFAFLPDSWNKYLNRAYKEPGTTPTPKPATPKNVVPQGPVPSKSTAPQATDNGPDPIPERAAAAIPRGSKVDVNGNTFRYTDPQGNVRYYNRETNGWVDYDPLSGPRRRR